MEKKNRKRVRVSMPAAPRIKRIIYEELASHPNVPFRLSYLRGVVTEKLGTEFSDGSYSGAMRDLVEETHGRIQNIERGVYVFYEDYKRVQIIRAINQLQETLNDIATDNILTLTDHDIETIRKIPNLDNNLERMKKDFEK